MHSHYRTHLLVIVVAFVLVPLTARAQDVYYPAPGDAWEHRSPLEVGMEPAKLAAAIDYAKAYESDAPRDLEQAHYLSFGSGVNMVYVDPVHDLVVVARWIEGDAMAEFVRLVLSSIEQDD